MSDFDAEFEAELALQDEMEMEMGEGVDEGVDAGVGAVVSGMENLTMSQMFTKLPPPTPILDTLGSSLADGGVEITSQNLGMATDELFKRWVKYQHDNAKWATVCVYRLFDIDPDTATCDLVKVLTLETHLKDTCLKLYSRMVNQGAINPDDETDGLSKKITRVLHNVTQSALLIASNHHRHNSTTTNYNTNVLQRGRVGVGLGLAGGEDAIATLTNGQRCILRVLESALSQNLRKHHGYLFKQVLTVDDNGREYRTHAWKSLCTIKDFVYQCSDKHQDFDAWCDLTGSMKNPDFVADYISNSTCDFELRSLDANRHIFSFRNGVYDAFMDTMYSYETGIPDHFVSAKFFDVTMPDQHPHGTSFRDIPTPVLDGVLSYQGFGTEPHVPKKYSDDSEAPGFSVTDWIYVFMGRMIYSIGEFDEWQVLMFMKGKAGTGKSTLGKVMSNLYNPVDVAVLSNNIEQKFGLSSICDALIYLCYEVKKDFKLDQGEMQSMISGEPISLAVKNKQAKSLSWGSHGFFMGNEFPRWTNNSGSIGRRIVVALFDTFVKDGDPKLFDKLQGEMGNIIVKINRAYRECSAAYGGDDIWSVLPPYFDEQRERQLEAATSSLSAFLVYLRYEDNGKTYTFDSEASSPSTRFKQYASEYITNTLGVKSYDWNKERDHLARYKLKLEGDQILGIRASNDVDTSFS